ncbi:HhH-GPD family protein [Geomonas agri]|uniref:hypothetical protein n=1 Tax=Geomonas agri TaxID=2873702 RepID=UPI001CD548AE|nr:hypothetical protein [Geomonas agri]
MTRSNSRPINLPSSGRIKDFQLIITGWYEQNSREFPWRKKSSSLYQKIISEVLLQRTRAETVAAFFPAFIFTFPTWKALAMASESELAVFIRPIGLWQRRASILSQLGKEMARRNGRFPRTRPEIEALPGVGQYIANAIQLFSEGKPMPLLDVNMARVLERYFGPRTLADIRHDQYLQQLSLKIVDCDNPQKMNWAILDLAALVCRTDQPKHFACPLNRGCIFLRNISKSNEL